VHAVLGEIEAKAIATTTRQIRADAEANDETLREHFKVAGLKFRESNIETD